MLGPLETAVSYTKILGTKQKSLTLLGLNIYIYIYFGYELL